MKIKNLRVNGYRCLNDFAVELEPDVTVIVGENDSGKSTLIDALKTITRGQIVGVEDFTYGMNDITLDLEVDEFVFTKKYHRDQGRVDIPSMQAKPSATFLNRLKERLSSSDFNSGKPGNESYIREIASVFGIPVRSNSNIANIIKTITAMTQELLDNPNRTIETANFPEFSSIQLDGKHFENVSAFFKEVFLKEKQASIWKEETEGGISIEQIVKTRIDEYSENISKEIADTGIKDKIKVFIKNLTDIKVEPIYQSRDLNIDAKVMFLENGQEINVDKKGDGTKRRITMALLDFKKDREMIGHEQNRIYMLDEPDTHLHAKAQLELLETLYAFASRGNQVILTTHSPFIMNAVKPHQVRILSLESTNITSVKRLETEAETSSEILRDLGIDNVYLFFARTIILVEGQTEEMFITHHFLKRTGKVINSSLVKIINVEGIHNIPGFARAILELHNKEKLFVLYDNDASDELKDLIKRLDIPENQKLIVGTNEFEDAFSDEALFYCWKKYYEEINAVPPQNWTSENISIIRTECTSKKEKKFSDEIRVLNREGKQMTKPNFGKALGKHLEQADLPEKLKMLFNSIE